jgi:mannitol-1-phosphate 5-dehydrogenase
MRAVIVGAGKVGCGFLVPLLRAARWETVLVTRTPERARRIRSARGFDVRITRGPVERIDDVRAVPIGSTAFDDAVRKTDLVLTAVGVENLAALGRSLTRALAGRGPNAPLNVLVIENQDCAPALAAAVRDSAAGLDDRLPRVGFAGAVADVVVARGSWSEPGRPEFLRDEARRVLVDRSRLVTPLPPLPGVRAAEDYTARLREKLFVFNAGHALCAYLGALRRHESVDEAVRDPFLRPLVAGCLLEARRAILSLHPRLGHDISGPVADALRRYGNEELADPIARVARDPIRKLRSNDRLVGPARLIQTATGCVPAHFALGIAAAFLYRHARDIEALRLAALLRAQGLNRVLSTICKLEPHEDLARAVAVSYHGFILTRAGAIFPPVYPQPTPVAEVAR